MPKRWIARGAYWFAVFVGMRGAAHASEGEERWRVVETIGDRRELTCVFADGDALWFGALGSGMLRVTGDRTERFGTRAGLPGARVRDCQREGESIWVATEAGVARWEASSQRFVTIARGRFLRLALSPTRKLAADGHGRVLALEHDRARRIARVDFAPSALAVSADGQRWAAGGSQGELFVSDAERPVDLRAAGLARPEPIERLSFRGETLLVRTTDHALEYPRGRSTSTRQALASAATAGTPAARPGGPAAARELSGAIDAASRGARGVHVHATATFRGRRVFATDAGAFVEGAAGHWTLLPLGDGLPCGDRIAALAVHRGVLWAGSFDQGLCRRDPNGWTSIRGPHVLPSDMIHDLRSDGSRLYVATARGLSVLEPDGRFRRYQHRDCIGRLQRDCPWAAPVNGVAFDAQRGHTWIADLRAVHRVDRRGWKHIGGEAVGSLALTRVAARDGEIAVGSGDRGLSLGRGRRFERIDDQAGLADNWVTDLTYDAAGRLWVATCTRGVTVREPSGRMRTLTRADGLIDDFTLSVNALGDALWVGTLSGVSIVRDGSVWSLSTAEGLSGNEVHDAVLFEGRVWLATDAGLSVLEPER